MKTVAAVAVDGAADIMKSIMAAAMKAVVVDPGKVDCGCPHVLESEETATFERHAMKNVMIIPVLVLLGATTVAAETYTWTDGQGVVSFTDNPARIPSRYRSLALRVKAADSDVRDPEVLRELSDEVEKPRPDAAATFRGVATAVSEQAAPSAGERQQELKGHLGGDQPDPTPPSMKQPKPVRADDQPKGTPAGMKQPKPLPPDDQPKEPPAGMKQPKPIPPGDQPKTMPAGMEQPEPKK